MCDCRSFSKNKFLLLALLLLLSGTFLQGCNLPIGSINGKNDTNTANIGGGVQDVQVFVEPQAGDGFLADAINNAQKSIWLEMYLLTNQHLINALEEAAQRGIDVRVLLEIHPYGSGSSSPQQTLDKLTAAGVKAQASSPNFSLTHEKGMIIDGKTAFIMTSNFTKSALGGSSSGGVFYANREYDIVDTTAEDVQVITDIFNADWNHAETQSTNSNLVISPTNSRAMLTSLIDSAHATLIVEAEEMQDDGIEQALINAVKRGVQTQVILPAPKDTSNDSNSVGINTIKQGGVQVKEDSQLYMHAKIMVVDGQKAFVGSENISSASLDGNRELGILIANQSVLTTLQQTFQQDWTNSQSV